MADSGDEGGGGGVCEGESNRGTGDVFFNGWIGEKNHPGERRRREGKICPTVVFAFDS